jgi:hypothetical protein
VRRDPLAPSQTSGHACIMQEDRLAPGRNARACSATFAACDFPPLPDTHVVSTNSSVGASAATEEGWTQVGLSKQMAKAIQKDSSQPNPGKGKAVNKVDNSDQAQAPVPSIKVMPPHSKGSSSANKEKGKAPMPTVAIASTSRPARAGPLSQKTKTWYDPDDLDIDRGSRADRTVRVVLPSDVRNATRSTFIDQVSAVVGLNALEACGPAASPNIWLLTFVSKDARGAFVRAGDFLTKEGHMAKIAGKDPAKCWIKIHWVPYQVPMVNALRQLDATEGIKILAASYDKVNGHEGLQHVRSLLRTVLIEAPDLTKVPYALQWNHEGLSGQALVTMRGRAPVCLRCNDKGHVRKDCQAVKCSVCFQWGHNDPQCTSRPGYSTIARGRPAFDDTVDLVTEDIEPVDVVAPTAAGDQVIGVNSQVSLAEDRPTVVKPITRALDEIYINPQPTEVPVVAGDQVLSWAERSDDDVIVPLARPPLLSPISASAGSTEGELSDSSAACESPPAGGTSVGGVKRNRSSKRERNRLGSTQSVSPMAKKK